jgi:tetratricopeptide (TPR) repeat protein
VNGLSRLRRARVSKALNQRRTGILRRGEERSNPLVRSWSLTKSATVKAIGVWSVLTSIALSAMGTLLFLALSYLLYQSVTSSAIEIAPISVPKDFAEKGYTSEAMTLELREALLDLVKQARTDKRTVNVVSQKDEPAIDLPQTGMSLDTIAAEIRKRFGFGDWWRVSGSIESIDGKLKLNIDLDGAHDHKDVSNSASMNQIGELFSFAAHNIFDIIDPYIVASSYADNDPKTSIERARKIILTSSTDRSNAGWAHVLMSYVRRHNSIETKKQSKIAIELDNNIAVAHLNLGVSLANEDKYQEAFEEFREAIWLNNNYSAAHNYLGLLLANHGYHRLAVEELNRAINLDPHDSSAHANLGWALQLNGEQDAALEELAKAIESDPEDGYAHAQLGSIYAYQGKLDPAIEEYREAISADPGNANIHVNLASALKSKGDFNAAVEEFDEGVSLQPDNPTYLNAQKEALKERDGRRKALTAEASDDPPPMPPEPP